MIWEEPASQNRWTILGFKSPGHSGWVCPSKSWGFRWLSLEFWSWSLARLCKTALAQPYPCVIHGWNHDERRWEYMIWKWRFLRDHFKFGWCSCCDMGSTASVAARWQLLQDSLYFIAQPPGGVCLVLDWDTWQRSRWRHLATERNMRQKTRLYAISTSVFLVCFPWCFHPSPMHHLFFLW